ncbi:hypothetical protein [Microbacterium oleivorans]|uniref:hypothetical protein n=1 Tax=Microbacterium oleivorans TaxID=273677 RepID=UPI00080EE209|nr:hypothetical protein [Microbacterium oleivorans]
MSDEYYSTEGTYVRIREDRRYAEREAERAWGWWSRKRAAAALRELEETDGLAAAAEEWARILIYEELERAWAQTSPGANAWHPRLLSHLPQLAPAVVAAASERPNVDTLVQRHLTQQAVTAIATHKVAEIQKVVTDPKIYIRHGTNEGDPMTVVQHAASGLRARFTVRALDGRGVVFSKPYAIASIDPDDPDHQGQGWERYVGLGIGRRLYLAAAAFHPRTRWSSDLVSQHAQPLRSRLHAADPYVWSGECSWCDDRLIVWQTADPAVFDPHPLTPAPPAVTPRFIDVTPSE